jgi:uncharacterized protein YbcI
MEKLDPSVVQQIAQVAIAFQQQQTGHEPQSVTVVLSGETLRITLHEALSPAEKALAQSPGGAIQVQNFHRQLVTNCVKALRQEIKRITGVEVREATAEVETTTSTVVQVFTTGKMAQVAVVPEAFEVSQPQAERVELNNEGAPIDGWQARRCALSETRNDNCSDKLDLAKTD